MPLKTKNPEDNQYIIQYDCAKSIALYSIEIQMYQFKYKEPRKNTL